jgi:hypothetical protein
MTEWPKSLSALLLGVKDWLPAHSRARNGADREVPFTRKSCTKRLVVPKLAAELTMTVCGGGSNALLGHFPTVELCARSLSTVDPIDIDVLTPNKEKMNE